MSNRDEFITNFTGDEEVAKVLKVAAGHIYNLINNIYDGHYSINVNNVPITLAATPESLLLTSPYIAAEITDLSTPIGDYFTEDTSDLVEAYSIGWLMQAIHDIMQVNNMDDPEQFTHF